MLDDDLAHALATGIHFEWADDEHGLFVPLIDATIMRVDGKRLEKIAQPIVEALWNELRPLVADALREQAVKSEFVAESLGEALVDVSLGPSESRLAHAVIEQAALDLAGQRVLSRDVPRLRRGRARARAVGTPAGARRARRGSARAPLRA